MPVATGEGEVRAAACEATAECALRLTLTEGKYHQVKRMVAAVENRVETLHRSRIGDIEYTAGPVTEIADLPDCDTASLAHWILGKGRVDLPQLDRVDLYETRGCGAIALRARVSASTRKLPPAR